MSPSARASVAGDVKQPVESELGMPRNQSEKGPIVLQDKYVTPTTWGRTAHVRLIALADGTYDVATCGNQADHKKIGHKYVATLDEAQAVYECFQENFSFINIPGNGWVNTFDGPK